MENYEACYHKTQDSFFECTELCSDFDHWCQQNCTAKYIAQLDKCPCMAKCPGEFLRITAHIHNEVKGGCPCDEYDCSQPEEPFDIELLIINPKSHQNDKPKLEQIKFFMTFQNDSVIEQYHPQNMILPESFEASKHHMCQFISHGRMFLAGGDNEKSHR